TWPFAGNTPAAGSGDTENKMAFDEAATYRGNSGRLVLSGIGPMAIWSTSCIASRSTTERFSEPKFTTTGADGFTTAIDSGRFPTRIGDKKLWLASENTSICPNV